MAKKSLSKIISLGATPSITGGIGSSKFGQFELNEANPVSDWVSKTGGSVNSCFSLLNKLTDGSNAILTGNVKIQYILGQQYREYAICDMVKNTSDLATIFYFTSSHMGKGGIMCELPANCLFRFVLEPNTGDDVIIEWVC